MKVRQKPEPTFIMVRFHHRASASQHPKITAQKKLPSAPTVARSRPQMSQKVQRLIYVTCDIFGDGSFRLV
jgi:hypothetical protein